MRHIYVKTKITKEESEKLDNLIKEEAGYKEYFDRLKYAETLHKKTNIVYGIALSMIALCIAIYNLDYTYISLGFLIFATLLIIIGDVRFRGAESKDVNDIRRTIDLFLEEKDFKETFKVDSIGSEHIYIHIDKSLCKIRIGNFTAQEFSNIHHNEEVELNVKYRIIFPGKYEKKYYLK